MRSYEQEFEKLAMEVFHSRIVPYCQYNKLSFTMMNGIPRLINANNEYVTPPKFIVNIFDIEDNHGNKLLWQITESYKYNDSVDFNMADFKRHKRRYANRPLTSLIFSPFF